MRRLRHPIAVLPVAFLCACGGGSSAPATTSPPVTTTETFSGTTTQSGAGSCGGDSHNFSARDGAISARLVQTSDPAQALSIQICANGIDNRNCSINQQKITVGQTLNGARIGDATQNLKMLPHSCVFGGTIVPSVTYTVSVTYQK
jgi:hypothetical protein